eukprot:1157735-Pelagomonas_calceolata.AAC.3
MAVEIKLIQIPRGRKRRIQQTLLPFHYETVCKRGDKIEQCTQANICRKDLSAQSLAGLSPETSKCTSSVWPLLFFWDLPHLPAKGTSYTHFVLRRQEAKLLNVSFPKPLTKIKSLCTGGQDGAMDCGGKEGAEAVCSRVYTTFPPTQ